ncbi:hypothetical protein IWW52_002841 [Coemansia sp. RSA 2704]|nr:hypothetical protein IWW52_002841 [Coemansia sp. RSA 2704]
MYRESIFEDCSSSEGEGAGEGEGLGGRVAALEAELVVRRGEVEQLLAQQGEQEQLAARLADALQCAVCLEPVAQAQALACGHAFCLKCLRAWLGAHRQCPTCRAPVATRPTPAYALQECARCLGVESAAPAADPWEQLFPDGSPGREPSASPPESLFDSMDSLDSADLRLERVARRQIHEQRSHEQQIQEQRIQEQLIHEQRIHEQRIHEQLIHEQLIQDTPPELRDRLRYVLDQPPPDAPRPPRRTAEPAEALDSLRARMRFMRERLVQRLPPEHRAPMQLLPESWDRGLRAEDAWSRERRDWRAEDAWRREDRGLRAEAAWSRERRDWRAEDAWRREDRGLRAEAAWGREAAGRGRRVEDAWAHSAQGWDERADSLTERIRRMRRQLEHTLRPASPGGEPAYPRRQLEHTLRPASPGGEPAYPRRRGPDAQASVDSMLAHVQQLQEELRQHARRRLGDEPPDTQLVRRRLGDEPPDTQLVRRRLGDEPPDTQLIRLRRRSGSEDLNEILGNLGIPGPANR